VANTFKITSWMAKEILRHFENNLVLAKFVNKDYKKNFTSEDFRPGTTINIPKPSRATAVQGATASFPDLTEESVSLTINQWNTSFAPTSVEMTTQVSRDQWSERYIKPQAIALANQVDADGFAAALTQVSNATGVAGTTPSALATYLTGNAMLAENSMPMDGDVAVVINPAAQASILDATKGLFQSSSDIAKQYQEGKMGLAIGAKWSMDQNVGVHATGVQGGTPAVNGASQSGPSLVTNGWTSAVAVRLKAGDIFTIAGVFAVNPVSKKSTGRLRTFVVTADTSSDGSGNATIPISPAIVGPGSTLQNVSALPASGALLTCQTANVSQVDNLILHKSALTLASVPMATYGGLDKCAIEYDPDTGIAIRVTQGMDVTNDRLLVRADVLYGWTFLRPEWAVKVLG
jgi:hypothetical protein